MRHYFVQFLLLFVFVSSWALVSSCSQTHCVGVTGTGNTASQSRQRGGHCAGVNSTGTFKPHVPNSKAKENGNFDPKMERQLAKSKYKPIQKKKLEFK